MNNCEYVPKNLLKIIDQLDIREDVCQHILKYAPVGTITPKQIKKFMAIMSDAHSVYVQARIDNTDYKETDRLLVPYYNKAFQLLIKLIKTIIYINKRTRAYGKELLSDMYMHLVVWRDFVTKRRGLTKIVAAVFNATKGTLIVDNLEKADRVINNYICFVLAGRVNNYEIKKAIHYRINVDADDAEALATQEAFGNYKLYNPYYKQETLINRAYMIDAILDLPYSIKDIRIDRDLFDRILRNYLKVFVMGTKKAVVDTSKFEVAYTIYKLKQFVMYSGASIGMIKGNDASDIYNAIYPSFTKMLADKLEVEYAD